MKWQMFSESVTDLQSVAVCALADCKSAKRSDRCKKHLSPANALTVSVICRESDRWEMKSKNLYQLTIRLTLRDVDDAPADSCSLEYCTWTAEATNRVPKDHLLRCKRRQNAKQKATFWNACRKYLIFNELQISHAFRSSYSVLC